MNVKIGVHHLLNIGYRLSGHKVRYLSRSVVTMDINHVVVIGSGLMGSGISQVSAEYGCEVTMIDQTDEILQRARKNIETSLGRIVKKKFSGDKPAAEKYVKEVMGRIKPSTSVPDAVKGADLVVEAIVENMEAKRNLFKMVEKETSRNTIIASNTSSLSLEDISKNIKEKDRFAGLHFFNPVPMMRLVEVVRTSNTSEDTINSLVKFGEKLEKTPVLCKDTPGFIVNRLLVPAAIEAVRLYERGDASMKDIDIAMKLGAGHPMGPLELMDYIGLDTCKFIIDGWHERFPDEPLFKPSPLLDELVKEGKLGRKTGEGFYKYK